MQRQKHDRDYLIKYIKHALRIASSDQMLVCRDGLEDALVELEKPVLPDNYEKLILNVLNNHGVSAPYVVVDVLLRELRQALLPKPRTKTVWRVEWGVAPKRGLSDCATLHDLTRELELRIDEPGLNVVKTMVPV